MSCAVLSIREVATIPYHAVAHGWRVEWWGRARPVFFDPRGQAHFDGNWQPPQLGPEPVTALLDEHRHLGIEPDERTAGARWQRERDVPAETYFRAAESV